MEILQQKINDNKANHDTLLYDVAIGLLPGIGSMLTRQLVSYCGSSENIFRQTKGKLKKIPGIGEVLAGAIINQNILKDAETELRLAEKSGTKLLFYTDKNYPERLKHIADAPTLLYYYGNADLNPARAIAIVGTRKATEYGREMVEKLVQELASFSPLIISGLAYGIDIAAHKASLTNNQQTIGVMASGIDIIYPSVHRDTAKKMVNMGGLITENRFGSKPDAPKFPARNRIIAGMCDALIVVEAAVKGGALITADIAASYDREVFSVPGRLGDNYSEGCNMLIRDHKAHILTSATDLIKMMNWEEGNNKPEKLKVDYSDLNPEESQVVNLLLGRDSVLLDDLSWKSQIPVGRVAATLLNLEFRGIVKSLPGKKYKLIAG
jgi:DNA processing protein